MSIELPRMGHEVTVCPDGLTAAAAMERNSYDCLLVDLDTRPAPAEAQGATTFVFQGAGWGHGAGMSQNGARNMAASGASHVGILAHYYPNTVVSTVATLDRIRVHTRGAPQRRGGDRRRGHLPRRRER